MAKVLVTGGAGFIGSHLSKRLIDGGHEVVCLDNFDPYYNPETKQKNITALASNKDFTLVEGDIRDCELMRRLLEGVEYIFHEAAQPGVRISIKEPMKSHDINASGTLQLLEIALDSDIKKVIYASSSSVYGKVKYLPFDEEHPKQPISPYGVSKLMAEEYCRVFDEVYGLRTISLRYFTVYGPRMRPDMAINIFTRKALEGNPLEIFGTGEKTRDFTYIDDVVEANMLAMSCGSGVYNIGCCRRITLMELAQMIVRQTGSKSEIFNRPDEVGDAQDTLADNSKAKRELGWTPFVDIEDGIGNYVNWYKSSQLDV